MENKKCVCPPFPIGVSAAAGALGGNVVEWASAGIDEGLSLASQVGSAALAGAGINYEATAIKSAIDNPQYWVNPPAANAQNIMNFVVIPMVAGAVDLGAGSAAAGNVSSAVSNLGFSTPAPELADTGVGALISGGVAAAQEAATRPAK
jgi:hypothetical protein